MNAEELAFADSLYKQGYTCSYIANVLGTLRGKVRFCLMQHYREKNDNDSPKDQEAARVKEASIGQ